MSSPGSRLFRNTFALSIPSFLNPLIAFVLVLLISRYLGVEGLGTYALVFSFLSIFQVLASLGLEAYIVREVARRPQDIHRFFSNSIAFGAVTSGLAALAMNIIVPAMGYDREVVQACMVGSISIVFATSGVYLESLFRARERSEFIALTYVVENLVRVVICTALLLTGHGIVVVFAAILGSRMFGFLFMFSLYVKVVGAPSLTFNREIWRALVRESPVFLSIGVFAAIHLSTDQIMLSKMMNLDAVGIYSSANRLLGMCKTFPVAFSLALLPMFAKAHQSSPTELKRLTLLALRYLFLGTFPIVAGTAVLGNRFIELIYGPKFAAAGLVLQAHIFSLVPFGMVIILARVLIATDNQRVDLSINAVAAAINVVMNFVLIPHFAELGAVIATFLTVVVFNQLQYWFIKNRLFSVRFLEIFPKPLAAAVVMGVVTFLLKDWYLVGNVLVSAGVYAGLLVAFRAISAEEAAFFRGLVKSRAG